MSISLLVTCLQIGLCFGLCAVGIYISFKILDTPDLTVDGSFTLGASVSAILCLNNMPILALIVAIIAGMISGMVTGILHTKLKIQVVLSGILTMTALYSINFWITNRKPSIVLYQNKTIFSAFDFLKSSSFLSTNLKELADLGMLLIIVILVIVLLNIFFQSNLGLAIRATGDNEQMVRSSSINTDLMKIIALALANSLVSLSGALYVQLQANYDNSYGVGMMVIGLASIIIGEAIFKKRKLLFAFMIVIGGSVLYQFMYMAALLVDGINPIDIKIITALIIVLSVYIPTLINKIKKRGCKKCLK